MWWRRGLALYAMLPAAATFYFYVFWRWFDVWRARRSLTYVLFGSSFVVVGVVVVVGRRWSLAGRFEPPAPVEWLGWAAIAVSVVFGTVADRQIGLRVRTFMPLFDQHGRVELKTTGAYGVVRHPIYASGSAFQLGVFLVTGYPGVLVAWAIFTLGAVWFTAQEERHLVALLDDPTAYDRYRHSVPALVPRLRFPRHPTPDR